MTYKETPKKDNKEGVRNFDATEVKEISKYIQTNVPFSVLEQLFPLTENVINKVKVFTIVYRMLNSAKNYTAKEETRKKLITMLDDCKDIYHDLYNSLIIHEEGGFGSYQHHRKIIDILQNIDKNTKVNNLIDAFLLFAEKQTFFDVNKIAGIESGRREGGVIVDKILGESTEQ